MSDYTDAYQQPYVNDFPIGRTAETAALIGSSFPWNDEAEQWLVWLQFEGMDRKAKIDGFDLVEFYNRGEISVRELGEMDADFRALLTQRGHRLEDFIWRRFEGVAQRGPVSYWLEAEAVHDAGQDALAQAELEEGMPSA